MDEFVIEIATLTIAIQSRYETTKLYFQDYLTDRCGQYSVCVTIDALLAEQTALNLEADQEGIRRRVFSDPFLERSYIMRKTAEFALENGTLLLHGSTVVVDQRAYLFTADCGVGKSTHTRFWRSIFGERAAMLNDDRAFIKKDSGQIIAYSSPWTGKHGIGSNIHAPLAGICFLNRGQKNCIQRIEKEQSIHLIYKQFFLPKETYQEKVLSLAESMLDQIPVWQMSCTKEAHAAEISYQAMSRPGK